MNTTTLSRRINAQLLAQSNKSVHRAVSTAAARTAGSQRLNIHTTAKHEVALAVPPPLSESTPPSGSKHGSSPLSRLPFAEILRTYLITSISSSPFLLEKSSAGLRRMLDSNNWLTDPDRNPVLKTLLWHTFYKQFCAGETPQQVAKATEELRSLGYSGVILEYALEVLKDAEGNEAEDVATWRKGLLDTIDMSTAGDFIGLKWSGMGAAAMRLMAKEEKPSKAMLEAMHTVCEAAANKNVSLLPAAEETWTLQGFFNWCIDMQREYNTKGKSVVYTTYQAYLKQMPTHINNHLSLAAREHFTLGAKLVRGAYLGSEKRHLIHDTIQDTHTAYDTIASAFIHRGNNDLVTAKDSAWPHINFMMASHNMSSVQKAQALRRAQAARGEELTALAFAQLQGMADEVSCNLLAAAAQQQAQNQKSDGDQAPVVNERVYKCTTWGTVTQCLNYLLRRAAENKDAAGRTSETRAAMGKEIMRRLQLA